MRQSSSYAVASVVVIGLLFHAVYLVSVLDIYFRSPIVHGMPLVHIGQELLPNNNSNVDRISPPRPLFSSSPSSSSPDQNDEDNDDEDVGPARRLVLFVGDGLRADKLLELDDEGNTNAPFIRSIIHKKGSWGISHTRMPTETRPGHVAMIAGLYEDVSAVMTGWQANPVEFDSVFNRSRNTFGWGSPDVLLMFAHHSPNVHVECYSSEMENFATNASILDTWVFEHVESLMSRAHVDAVLREKVSGPRTIFFLHLLGIDTTGHAYRPTSREYLENIKVVDEGVERMYNLFEEYLFLIFIYFYVIYVIYIQ
eukprot:TRINITY_DN1100_c2_g1_i7.p1 TRINITY_DN1100_c2_g1~~TRINITY_DN1100_c2_g1_i7.p1  ORF type:complete len:311 (-),score=67.84 TRINITY_DN1100_c2_g1_i7:115-1047(-)